MKNLFIAAVALASLGGAFGCTEVQTYGEIQGAIDAAESGVVLLCPFSVKHDDTDLNSTVRIDKIGTTLICVKNNLDDRCLIEGTGKHFDVDANSATFVGFDFTGSQNGAVNANSTIGTTFMNCNFSQNKKTLGVGGAIETTINGNENVFVIGSFFDGNYAEGGGAIYGGGVSIVSSTFTNNEANEGGATYIADGYIASSSFDYNHAIDNGPAVYTHAKVCTLGLNHACHSDGWRENTCDGVQTSGESPMCVKFDSTCEYPSASPTSTPSSEPSSKPSLSLLPSALPTSKPSKTPSAKPSSEPSLLPSNKPSLLPSKEPSSLPSSKPSASPTSKPSISPTSFPSSKPSASPTSKPSSTPTSSPSLLPSSEPSSFPSSKPSTTPTSSPSSLPSSEPSASPTSKPSTTPTSSPSSLPSSKPSGSPTSKPSTTPSSLPTTSPSLLPTFSVLPTNAPSFIPSQSLEPSTGPSSVPSANPSLSNSPSQRCNMDASERSIQITSIINHESEALNITIDNRVLNWLIEEDPSYTCPQDDNLLQRYAVASIVRQFGDPNLDGHECDWPGIRCGMDNTIIKLRKNGVNSVVPREIEMIASLQRVNVQSGNLHGVIDKNLFKLPSLIEVDLDKNSLSGNISVEEASSVLRLDLNFNFLSGGVDFLTSFPDLQEAHLDNNNFEGKIPASIGDMHNLKILTLHGNNLTGTMPQSICDLRSNHKLRVLMADCDVSDGRTPKVECDCCTHCNPYRK